MKRLSLRFRGLSIFPHQCIVDLAPFPVSAQLSNRLFPDLGLEIPTCGRERNGHRAVVKEDYCIMIDAAKAGGRLHRRRRRSRRSLRPGGGGGVGGQRPRHTNQTTLSLARSRRANAVARIYTSIRHSPISLTYTRVAVDRSINIITFSSPPLPAVRWANTPEEGRKTELGPGTLAGPPEWAKIRTYTWGRCDGLGLKNRYEGSFLTSH